MRWGTVVESRGQSDGMWCRGLLISGSQVRILHGSPLFSKIYDTVPRLTLTSGKHTFPIFPL